MANLGFNIRWADNTAQLKKNLAEGLDQIETTRAAVDKIAKSLGGENLIRAAHNYAAALQKIGGEAGALSTIEKLTSQERTRSIALLEKAIQKYQVLGKEAPQALRDILTETKRVATANGELDKPLAGAGNSIAGLTSKLGGLASAVGIGFSVGAVVNFGKSILADADALVKMSDKTGISTDWLQRFQVAGDDAGNTVEEMSAAINQMQNRIAGGDKSAVAALQKLNINVAEFAAMRPEEQFVAFSDAIRGVQDPAQQVALGMDVMGKSFTTVLPTIKRGFDDVKNAAVGMSAETVKALDEMGDKWAEWWRATKGYSAEAIVYFSDKIPKAYSVLAGTFASNQLKAGIQQIADINEQLRIMNERLAKSGSPFKAQGLPVIQQPAPWELRDLDDAIQKDIRRKEEQAAAAKRAREEQERFNDAFARTTQLVRNLEQTPFSSQFGFGGLLNTSALKLDTRDVEAYKQILATRQKIAEIEQQALHGQFGYGSTLGQIAGKLGGAQSVGVEKLEIHVRGLADAFKSLGSGDIKTVLKDVGGFFKGGIGKIGTGFLEGIGNAALGGLTSLLNAGLGALGKGFKKLWDGITDAAGRRTNDLRDKFQASFGKNGVGGSLDDLVRGFTKVGLSIEDVNRLLHAGTEKELQRVIDTFNKATSTQRTAFDKLNGYVEKYGFTIEELGPAFRAQKLGDQAADLYEAYKLLTASGVDSATVLKRLAGVVIDTAEDGTQKVTDWGTGLGNLIHQAIITGTALPKELEPIVRQMIDLGLITRDDGTKFGSLEEAGLSFTDNLTQGFKDVVTAIDGLTAALKDGLNIGLSAAEQKAKDLKAALDRIPDGAGIFGINDVRRDLVKRKFGVDAVPMASGGAGMVTQPTLFLAGEAGPEYVSFTPQAMVSQSSMRGGGGGGRVEVRQPAVFHLMLPNGNVLTSVVVDDVLKDKRGAGTKFRRAMKGAA